MAEKRHLEAVGSVTYSKLPRLAADPGHLLAAGSCRLNALPGYPLENHYSYKGSYFAYPLQCHESTKSLAPWMSTEAYTRCATNAANQQLMAEKALHKLYRPEAESFHPQGKSLGHRKGSECMAPEVLTVSEKWTDYMGHVGLVQQNWMPSCPVQPALRATPGFPTLAAPKPVYRNHSYCTELGYSPKGSFALGMQVENVPKQSPGADWALPASGPTRCGETSSYDPGVAKKSLVTGSRFLPVHQGSKEAAFSPFRKVFESCQGAPDTSVLEATYPAAYNCWKTAPDPHRDSPSKQAWPKVSLPASPLAASQSLTHSDKSSACYPFPSYPLLSPEQMILYQQSYAQVEKPNALFAWPACKELGSSGGEHPQLLPGSYFSPVPRNYYPHPLDTYLYPSIGHPPVPPSGFQPSEEREQQRNLRTKLDSLQEIPTSACSLPEKASYCGSSSGKDALLGCGEGDQVAKVASESFPNKWLVPQSEAVQTRRSCEKLPGHFGEFGQMPEAGCGAAVGPSEKASDREKERSYTPKEAASASEGKKRSAEAHRAEPGACVVVSDSLIAPRDSSYPKEDLLKNTLKGSVSPAEERTRDTERGAGPGLPSSPPMPVIHNVFSLAPYQEYLEGSVASVEMPLSKRCRAEERSSDNAGKCAENQDSPWQDSAAPLGKETAPHARKEVGQGDISSNCVGEEKGSRGYGEIWENYAIKHAPPNGPGPSLSVPVDCGHDRIGEITQGDCALDLRFKGEDLTEPPSFQKSPGKTEDAGREMSKSKAEETGENPAKEASQGTECQTSELTMKGGSGTKNHFHSSGAFLFKKFRILKSHTAGAGSVMQNVSSSYQISAKIAALANDVHMKPGPKQAATQQKSPSVQQSSHQVVTHQNSSMVQQSSHRAVTHQNSSTVQQSSPQVVPPQNSPVVQQNSRQAVTQQNSAPVKDDFYHHPLALQKSLPVQQSLHHAGAQSEVSFFLQNCFDTNSPDSSKPERVSQQADSPASGEAQGLLSTNSKSFGKQPSPMQYFTALHTSICSIISSTVSASSSEQLKEWLKIAETSGQAKEKAVAPAKHRSEGRASETLKEIWLTFKDMSSCFTKLLSQLKTFLFTRTCPFPHVVRAGTIFIPIHVVKETLFPNLSSTSVDHILQDHKVELRPTTLSEEKLLRDPDLKGCTLRMLKLLALKQLPDIYPDLLSLHWIYCVKQQLCPSSQPDQQTSK
uniref:Chromosome 15 open reading frame 39 n=1 Tax=Salvator merianae TaxID=96440 RepID=A0A8D0BST2_SALMN